MHTHTGIAKSLSPKAGMKEWAGLALLGLPTMLLTMDITVLYLALPSLADDLSASAAEALWIMDIYGFMIAGFLVTMGTLGDRIGRRRLLLTGAFVFGLASVAAAYSTSAHMLIATRALLGIAGATLMPSTLALITNMFADDRERALAIGLWATCFSIGAAAGPVVGGMMLEHFWWGSVFLLAVPVMALVVVIGPLLLPEYRDANAGRLDLSSVALSLAAMLAAVFGMKELARGGDIMIAILAVLAGLGLGWAFLRRQRILRDPIVDLSLFARPAFVLALAALLIGHAALGGLYLMVSQYLQMVESLSPLVAGLWLLPPAIGTIAASISAPRLTERLEVRLVIGTGLTVSAFGALLTAFGSVGEGPAVLILGFTAFYTGLGPLIALGPNVVVSAAAANRAGAASSLSETSMELGFAVGIAVFGSLATLAYRLRMHELDDLPLSPNLTDAARDSLAMALNLAAELPPAIAIPLREQAAAAFVSGLGAAGLASAAILFAIALLMALPFSGRRP